MNFNHRTEIVHFISISLWWLKNDLVFTKEDEIEVRGIFISELLKATNKISFELISQSGGNFIFAKKFDNEHLTYQVVEGIEFARECINRYNNGILKYGYTCFQCQEILPLDIYEIKEKRKIFFGPVLNYSNDYFNWIPKAKEKELYSFLVGNNFKQILQLPQNEKNLIVYKPRFIELETKFIENAVYIF